MIPSNDGLPTPARYYAMLVVLLGLTMTVLDGTLINLALPRITRDLQAGAAQTIWIINAYQIAILAFLLPCAALGDIIGYRRVYLGGLWLYALAAAACLACAFVPSLPALVAARAVQGLGAAGMMSVNTALVRAIYPSNLLGRGVAINSAVVAASAVAGPSVAAGILAVASWPWLFAVNLPFGIAVLAAGYRALPRRPSGNAKTALSPIDVLLNALMFALVFLGMDSLGARGSAPGGPSPAPGLIPLCAGVAVGIVYMRRQMRSPLPVFPVDLLRIPVFALSMGTSVTAFAAQTLAYVALPFLFLDAYGRTPWQAGMLITAWPLAIVVVAPLVGRMIGRIPDGTFGGIGLGILSAGLASLALLPAQPADADIVWRLAVCGIGFGLFQSPNNHTIVTSAPLHRSGGASGMLGAARLTGQSLGAVIVAIIFSIADAHNGHGPTVALALASAFAAVSGVFSSLRLGAAKGKSD
ncbi:MAG: MFS transporter [Candidatus Accumulibacter sp.]|jgi:DHA2 family multidrug resistance protein-like MFS transporter|nr:MFS transporter [Accumulibacter sp.]